MTTKTEDMTIETVTVPIQWVGTFAGSKCVRVTIDGEDLQLKVPMGRVVRDVDTDRPAT